MPVKTVASLHGGWTLSLETALGTWDGKSSDAIQAIGAAHRGASDYAAELVRLAADDNLQSGATWLLLALLKSGEPLDGQLTATLLDSLPQLETWDARLHVLQSLPYLAIAEQHRAIVEAFVRHNLTASNKFVRAWSYNGLYELARRFPAYREEVDLIFAMAMRDEAPSVKARIRNLCKTGYPED